MGASGNDMGSRERDSGMRGRERPANEVGLLADRTDPHHTLGGSAVAAEMPALAVALAVRLVVRLTRTEWNIGTR
jgi:hypothetical protein